MGLNSGNEHLRQVNEGLDEMVAGLGEAKRAFEAAYRKMYDARENLSDADGVMKSGLKHSRRALNRIGNQINPHYEMAREHLQNTDILQIDAEAARSTVDALIAYERGGQDFDVFQDHLLPALDELPGMLTAADTATYNVREAAQDMLSNFAVTSGRVANISNAIAQTNLAQQLLAVCMGEE